MKCFFPPGTLLSGAVYWTVSSASAPCLWSPATVDPFRQRPSLRRKISSPATGTPFSSCRTRQQGSSIKVRAAAAAAAVVVSAVVVAAASFAVVVSSAAANTHSPSLSYCSGFFHVLLQNLAFSTPSFPHAGLPSSSVGLRLRRLPPSLRTHPFLQEFYGTAEWSARAVYSGRNGWFGGNSNRFPNKKCDEIQINLQATFPS